MEVCMEIGAVFEIIIAAFAVFGLVCLLKFTGERIFRPKNIFMAAAIFDRESAEEADVLIEIIKSESGGLGYCLLISEEMLGDSDLAELIEYSGVRYYVVKNKS